MRVPHSVVAQAATTVPPVAARKVSSQSMPATMPMPAAMSPSTTGMTDRTNTATTCRARGSMSTHVWMSLITVVTTS